MPRAKLNSNQWSILGLAAAALSSAASSLYTVEHVQKRAIDLAAGRQALAPAQLAGALGPTDYALVGTAFVVCVLLVIGEWRAKAFSKLLRTATPIQNFYILTIIGAWLGHSYLFPGLLLAGDTGSHIARFLEMRVGFQQGAFPAWSNYQYLGSPLLEFTGPLTYVVGGILDLAVKDPVCTAKALLFVAHLATGWLFYGLLRRFGIIPPASLAAAIGLSGSFALLNLFLYRGVFPQAFTILLVILLFYAAEGLMRDTKHQARDWLIFAVSTAGIIINHQPHGFFVSAYLGLFTIASLFLGRWPWRNLTLLIGAGTMGVIISLVAWVPMLVEADRVMINPELGMFHFRIPTLHRLALLVAWQNVRMPGGAEWWAYLGLVFVAIALFGACSALVPPTRRAHGKLALVTSLCLLLSLFLYAPVVRDIIFVAFFIGIFAAIGMERLILLAKWESRLPLLVLVALLFDAASTSVQPLARTDKQHFVAAGEYLASAAPNERVIEAVIKRDGSFGLDIGPDATPLSYYTTIPRVAGYHNLAATHVHNFAETIIKMAERDLRSDGHLSPSTEILVAILNASRVVCFGSVANGCPKSFIASTSEGPLGDVVHIPNAGPIIFSKNVVLLAPATDLEKPLLWNEDYYPPNDDPKVTAVEGFLHRYVEIAEIDPATHTAAALPVRTLPPAPPSAAAVTGPSKQLVTGHSVSLERVLLRVESDAPGYLQISYPWYPDTQVLVNGQEVVPLRGALDLIVLTLQQGTNEIEIRPSTTPLGRGLAGLSCLALLVTLALAFAMHRRRERYATA
jgi:6-pyruvoyl-tetrahydropterin synthase related domain